MEAKRKRKGGVKGRKKKVEGRVIRQETKLKTGIKTITEEK